MFTIGEFSKINKISTRMLRHYDKIGLLKPAKIDSWTGYRYYSIEQINDIKKITILKNLNFPLKTIKKIKDNNYKNIEEFIKDQKYNLIKQMEEINIKIANLHELDFAKNIFNKYEKQIKIEIIQYPKIFLYSKEYILSHAIPTKLETLITELKQELKEKNIIPSGYPILFWKNEEFTPEKS